MSGSLIISFANLSPAGWNDEPDATLIVFVGAALAFGPVTTQLLGELDSAWLLRAAAEEGFRGRADESMRLVVNSRRVIFIGIGGAPFAPIELGGRAAALAGYAARFLIAVEFPQSGHYPTNAAAELALGFRLGSYRFDTYRTHKPEPQRPARRWVTLLTGSADADQAAYTRESAVAEGVELARSLVNEPANVLTPSEFARRAGALGEVGVDVQILREKDLERLGFRALLAVGQGSAEESHVAILRWNGATDPSMAPYAFIGKGVCFDAGGLSIKSAEGMAEMKGDMAGAACVTGLMLALARRKAPINAIGAIGLVENMPGGKAQRPGDIVRSLSGQTIEVIDTDYEGRLVLADLLWHVQANFRPCFMIDLATLTYDVITAVGHDRAGLFSNDDGIAERLEHAASATGELVWRLPMGPNFDVEMNSDIADMRNADAPFGGASTAANFIQRFVNDVPWAHLDISGPAHEVAKSSRSVGSGTGWGVRLLDRLVRDLEIQHDLSAR